MLAVQFAQHLPQRRMMLIYATLLVAGSILAAAATGPAMFIAGHVLQGLCTSLLLIAAAPPLFLGYPAAKLRWTAMIMNMCIFGAVAAGPLIGGAQASFHAWRPLFWIVAGIAVVALLLSLLTFEDAPPADRSAPWDGWAVGLAATGSVAAFWGAAELTTHRFLDPVAVAPLLGGLALIVILWVYQYRGKRTLLTLRPLASTIPLAGIVLAVCAAAASVSAIALTSTVLAPPLHAAAPGAALPARTRRGRDHRDRVRRGVQHPVHPLLTPWPGWPSWPWASWCIRSAVPPTSGLALAGSALIGVGVGASVTPALFLAGFSLRSASIQRVFAILELLRAVAAFMIAPILLHFATTLSGLPDPGHEHRVVGLLRARGRRRAGRRPALPAGRGAAVAPSLTRFLGGGEPGWESPPLLAAIRRRRGMRAGRAAGRAVTSGREETP